MNDLAERILKLPANKLELLERRLGAAALKHRPRNPMRADSANGSGEQGQFNGAALPHDATFAVGSHGNAPTAVKGGRPGSGDFGTAAPTSPLSENGPHARPVAPSAQGREEALLAKLDQLSDAEVNALLGEMLSEDVVERPQQGAPPTFDRKESGAANVEGADQEILARLDELSDEEIDSLLQKFSAGANT